MTLKLASAISLCSLLFTGAALLCAQSPPAPAEAPRLAKAVADKAAASRDYAFEGELVLEGRLGSGPGKMLSNAEVKLAIARPGKYMLRIAPVDKDEYLLASNGQKIWAFVPRLKQYTEEEGAQAGEDDDEESGGSDSERDLAETWSRLVMPTLARLYKTAHAADFNGLAEVKFEGKKQKWPVLRVMSKPDESEGQSLTELTLDPQTLAIGRMVWANLSKNKSGEKTLLRMTVNFTRFRMGEALPEATFNFEPPKNAKLVDAVPIPGQTGSFLVNQPAPDFELKTLDGERVRLADLRGKTVLLNFWATWCGPCRREMPDLVKVHEEFKEKGLVVLGVNDEGKGTARSFAQKAGIPFETLDDGGRKAHRLYRVRSVPSTFIINAEGKVVRYLSGAKNQETFRAALKGAGL